MQIKLQCTLRGMIPIFGGVLAMPYKTILIFILMFSSFTYASKNNIKDTYNNLSNKMSECSQIAKRDVEIQNKYLSSITINEQRAILLILSLESKRNCYVKDENKYALAVLNFAIETDEKEPLNAFIALRKFDNIDESIIRVFNSLDSSKIKIIRQELNMPFTAHRVTILE